MMKYLLHILLFVSLVFSFIACSDDEKSKEGGGTGDPAIVSFAESGVMVLKRAGKALVPVKMSKVSDDLVKAAIKVKAIGSGEEGKDFVLTAPFATINRDSLMGYLEITFPKEAPTAGDLKFSLELTEVYGSEVALAETDLECEVTAVSTAFITFAKKEEETQESAGTLDVEIRVNGEIKENTDVTVVLRSSDLSTAAEEGEHFTIEQKTITIPVGDTAAFVHVALTDDVEVNDDRFFEMVIAEVSAAGNALIGGKNDIVCKVIIRSEERTKYVNFPELMYGVDETIDDSIFLLPVKMDMVAENPVTVTLQAEDMTATAADYALLDDQVVIPAGDTVAYARVYIVNDLAVTGNRYFTVEMTGVSGANAELGAMKSSRITILEDDFNVTFEKADFEMAEDGDPITISLISSVMVDKETKVTLSLNEISAVRNVNYSIAEVEVVFVAGTDRTSATIAPINDGVITNPLRLEVGMALSDHPSAVLTTEKCNVKIKNEAIFDVQKFSFEEGSGTQTIVLQLLEAQTEALNLTLGVIGTPGSFISGLPNAAAIPQGVTTTGDINITMDQQDPLNEPPVVTLVATQIGDLVLETPDTVARITTLPCTYRKYLGNWTFSGDGYSSATAHAVRTFDLVIKAGNTEEEIAENFGKQLIGVGWPMPFSNSVTDLEWTMNYEDPAGTVTINMGAFKKSEVIYNSQSYVATFYFGSTPSNFYGNLTASPYLTNKVRGTPNIDGTEVNFLAPGTYWFRSMFIGNGSNYSVTGMHFREFTLKKK